MTNFIKQPQNFIAFKYVASSLIITIISLVMIARRSDVLLFWYCMIKQLFTFRWKSAIFCQPLSVISFVCKHSMCSIPTWLCNGKMLSYFYHIRCQCFFSSLKPKTRNAIKYSRLIKRNNWISICFSF